jgi:hypothetical protein
MEKKSDYKRQALLGVERFSEPGFSYSDPARGHNRMNA